MTHSPIHTGDGYHCPRCNVSWDQGDPEPADCLGLNCTQPIGPEEDGVRRIFDGERFFGATGEPEYLKADVVERRFWPIAERRIPPVPTSGSITWPTSFAADIADPMAVQHGGSHYKNLVIQPTEFVMRNGLDFCVGSILKYVTRHRSKNGVEDLKKALHFVQIREAFPYHIRPPGRIEITMLEYVTRNKVRTDDAEALYRLEAYYNGHYDPAVRAGATRLINEIDRLIALSA